MVGLTLIDSVTLMMGLVTSFAAAGEDSHYLVLPDSSSVLTRESAEFRDVKTMPRPGHSGMRHLVANRKRQAPPRIRPTSYDHWKEPWRYCHHCVITREPTEFMPDRQSISLLDQQSGGDMDLVPLELSITPSGALTTGGQIRVEWTVQNTGSDEITDYWQDDVVISTDQQIGCEDVHVVGWDSSDLTGLSSSEQYSRTWDDTLPTAFGTGTYYLILKTDRQSCDTYDQGNLTENDESNNTYIVPIEITEAAELDLEPTAFSVEPSTGLHTGQAVDLSWTVRNNRPDATAGSWSDTVFLSTDDTLDDDDIDVWDWWTHDVQPLGSGQTYTRNCTVLLPTSAEAGDYYLILQIDQDWWISAGHGRQWEADEENNNFAVPITITTTGQVDLMPTAFSLVTSNGLTTGQLIDLSWTVRNNGSDSAIGGWADAIFLSTTDTLDDDDLDVGESWTWDVQPLGPGEFYTLNYSTSLPTSIQAGEYYLILQVDQDWWNPDGYGRQLETNEENNEFAIPIAVTATGQVDLQPTAFAAVPSNGLTTGQPIDLSWTVVNNGSDSAVGGCQTRYSSLTTPRLTTTIQTSEIGGPGMCNRSKQVKRISASMRLCCQQVCKLATTT